MTAGRLKIWNGSAWVYAGAGRDGLRTRPSQGAICFTSPGVFEEVYSVAYPAFTALGQKSTVYLLDSWLDQATKITSAQVLEMFNAGHEIGNHGHFNVSMPAESLADRLTDWDTAKTNIEAIIGVGNCRHFAYPFGGVYDATTLSEGYLRYRTQLAFDAVPRHSSILPLGNTYEIVKSLIWKDNTHADIMEWINYAASNPVLLIINFGQPNDTANNGPTIAEFNAGVNLAAGLDIPCLTIDEALGNPIWHPNPGFEDGTVGWTLFSGGEFAVVAETPSDGMPGAYSGKLTRTGAEATAYFGTNGQFRYPGHIYTLSFRYHVTIRGGTGNITGSLAGVDLANASLSSVTTPALTGTTWTQTSLDYTTPPVAARQLQVGFSIPSTLDADLFIDHVHLGPKSLGVLG